MTRVSDLIRQAEDCLMVMLTVSLSDGDGVPVTCMPLGLSNSHEFVLVRDKELLNRYMFSLLELSRKKKGSLTLSFTLIY